MQMMDLCVTGVVVVGLIGYLTYVLMNPEEF